MPNQKLKNYSLKLGIKTWLKIICKRIDVQKLTIVANNSKEKIDKLDLVATNLIYKNLYINKLIIKINNFKLMFNHKNHILYSNNMVINCSLRIDSSNLEKTFLKNKWHETRTYLEDQLTEGKSIMYLYIYNDLINLNYQKDNLILKKIVTLKEKENLLFFEDVKNKKKVLLPLDKNIKVKNCLIKNELINIELSSKVNFND